MKELFPEHREFWTRFEDINILNAKFLVDVDDVVSSPQVVNQSQVIIVQSPQ